jgi:hypothetical protein
MRHNKWLGSAFFRAQYFPKGSNGTQGYVDSIRFQSETQNERAKKWSLCGRNTSLSAIVWSSLEAHSFKKGAKPCTQV